MRHRYFAFAAALILIPVGFAFSQAQQPDPDLGTQFQGAQRRAPRPQPPSRPTPHYSDGRVNFGPIEGEAGVWLPGPGGNPGEPWPPRTMKVPFQPWAEGVLAYRRQNQFEPHTRCKPSGGPRQFLTPYGVEFVERPELKRLFIMDIGGPHTFRVVFMDGRPHPKDWVPDYYGHSVGRWEGETLVIDTVGFNEGFWMSRGLPHTSQLHMIERFTRTNMNSMKYEVTVDDPGAYTEPWTAGFQLSWQAGTELFEYVCQDNNHAPELMLGSQESVDRSSPIVP